MKKSSDKMLPPVGIEPRQHYPFYTNLTFAYKTETLGSLYSHAVLILLNLTFAYKTETLGSLYNHAVLILLKSSKSKHQVVHEQKFKDLLSSTCQDSVERT